MGFINNMLQVGVVHTNTDKEKKRVKVLNLTIYIVLVHAVFFLFFDHATGSLDIQKLLTLVLEIFCFSMVILMQYKGWLKTARVFFTITVFVNLFYHSNYAFKGFYGEYQYIVIPLFSLFFFDKKYMHYGLLVLAIIAFYLPNYFYHNYPDQYFGYMNVSLLFVGVFLIVNYFKLLNDKKEYLLQMEKDQVLEDKILLEKQQKELEELNAFKARFFVNISHEIRTPITLIKGYLSRLQVKDEKSEENLSIIKTQTLTIQNIVNDLLDLSKLESNKLELNMEPVDIRLFITKLYTDYKALFTKKEIDFFISMDIPPIIINIDTNFFTKCLNNLLNNALKFTPRNGKVRLSVTFLNKLEISVIDNGVGIPKEDSNKVFERFYQSKNDITNSQGSGIGLSFAKSIAEAHGFKLELLSIPNEETEFTITIPEEAIKIIEQPNGLQTELPKELVNNILPPSVKNKRKTVLVVEDHDEMRAYFNLVLKDYKVIEATNGKEGLEAMAKYDFDAIISDYMMPVMDGVAFIYELKNRQIKVPILVLTARNDDTGKLNMLRLGIDAYLTKPFIEEELLLNLNRSIKLYTKIKDFEKSIPDEEIIQLADSDMDFNEELKKHVDENLTDRNFGVDQLAELMNLSRSSLFRKTKLVLGQTPNEIISEARLQKARVILTAKPSIKKKELAEAVGVYNVTYFYKKLEERFHFFD